ncbi:hypothetical protein [Romboutsia weinsteinii]|uniref:hypothetical protein n=1 Tax=Romboutsia weinsteinii TaxID=2020949 RepID=UPI0013149485|nr:hypothetical protein [Romboutsia weinsteinii]
MVAQFTNFLGDNNEISKDTLFIDGTKIESSAKLKVELKIYKYLSYFMKKEKTI